MNTNRSASQFTQHIKAKTLAAHQQSRTNNILLGNPVLRPGRSSDMSAGVHTEVVVGRKDCCISTSDGPTFTTYYVSFTTTGSTTWTAPATCQSPITYWIVGGGGGGGGAYDNAGGGGGGGGTARTGTYAVVPGTTYTIDVGAGGTGGDGRGSNNTPPPSGGSSQTDGTAGTSSSFDAGGGGPVAAGGGKGLKSRNNTAAGGGYGGVVSTGGYGGDGGYGGGGGGGAAGSGTNGGAFSAGTGGTGISFTIPGYNSGNPQSYGIGGNGGANINSSLSVVIGANGLVNTGNGGGGGGAGSYSPRYTDGVIRMGGNGGSGLVVIQYSA
jgi:hypothetical protein